MARKRLVDRIKDAIAQEGLVSRTNAARKWLGQKIRQMRLNQGAKLGMVNLSNKARLPNRSIVSTGKMYFYFYNPKTKDKLPYYDIFPLVIPLDYMPASKSATKKDPGFIGLNLHYLHPKYRVQILDEMYSISNNTKFDSTTKARLTYRMLVKHVALNRIGVKACLKWYLFKHVESRMLEIDADDWEITAFLPFEDFKKQSKSKVWSDSRRSK